MTKHFRDDEGRRWKAWRASRDVFWPEAAGDDRGGSDTSDPEESKEAVIFVCFSDPSQPQRRAHLPSGAFESLSSEDLKSEFASARPDPALS